MHGWRDWNPSFFGREGESTNMSMNPHSPFAFSPPYVDRTYSLSPLQLVAFQGRAKGIKGSLILVKSNPYSYRFTGRVGDLSKLEEARIRNSVMGFVVGILPVHRAKGYWSSQALDTFAYFMLIGEAIYLVEEEGLDITNVVESTRTKG